MAAGDNLSSQLWKKSEDGSVWAPLFATAREIHEHVNYGDQAGGMSKDTLMAKKVNEADAPPHDVGSLSAEKMPGHLGGLTNKIKNEGFDWSKPLEVNADILGETTLNDGHHRQAVMLRDRPDEFMPISTTQDAPPTSSERALDEQYFNHMVKTKGPEAAKFAMPLTHYPHLKPLHDAN